MTDSVKSTHIPELSGAVVSVTGDLTVDTELRHIQSFGATLAQGADANNAGVTATLVAPTAGGTYKLLLETWEDDNTTESTHAANVAWFAFGK